MRTETGSWIRRVAGQTGVAVAMLLLAALPAGRVVASEVTATWIGGTGNWNITGINNNWVTNGVVGWDPDADNDGQGDGTVDAILAGTDGAVITLNIEYHRNWNWLRSVVVSATNTFVVDRNCAQNCTVTNEGIIDYRRSLPGTVANNGSIVIRSNGMPGTITNTEGGTVTVVASQSWGNPVRTITGGTFTNNGTVNLDAEGGHLRSLTLTDVAAANSGTMRMHNIDGSTRATASNNSRIILAGATTFVNSGNLFMQNYSASTGNGHTFFQVNSNATLTTTSDSKITIQQMWSSRDGYSTRDAYLSLGVSSVSFTNNGLIQVTSTSSMGGGSTNVTAGVYEFRSARDVVNKGRLAVAGPRSSIILTDGATLTVSSGGILEPGLTNAVGTMAISGDVTLDEGAICKWDFEDGEGDLVTITGTLTLPATATINVTALGGELTEPASVFTATTLAGATDLSNWTLTGLPAYVVKRVDNTVVISPPPAGSLFLLR